MKQYSKQSYFAALPKC